MSLSTPGPFYVAADASGVDVNTPGLQYAVGRGAPDGRGERVTFTGYTDPALAARDAGPGGRVFEVRGRVAHTNPDGTPAFYAVTVLAELARA